MTDGVSDGIQWASFTMFLFAAYCTWAGRLKLAFFTLVVMSSLMLFTRTVDQFARINEDPEQRIDP